MSADDRSSDKASVESWGCVHGYTMPHADTLCPHCCPLAWRSGTTYSRDEYIAALEALEFSTRMATIEECARTVKSMTCHDSGERELRSDTAAHVRALREVKR